MGVLKHIFSKTCCLTPSPRCTYWAYIAADPFATVYVLSVHTSSIGIQLLSWTDIGADPFATVYASCVHTSSFGIQPLSRCCYCSCLCCCWCYSCRYCCCRNCLGRKGLFKNIIQNLHQITCVQKVRPEHTPYIG